MIGFVVSLLALMLPWTSSPAQAYVLPTLPTVLPGPLAGITTYAGLPAGVAAAPFDVVMSGVGAYQGTCYVLGAIASAVGSDTHCDLPGATQSIYNLVTTGSWFGAPAQYVGPAAYIGHDGYAGPLSPFQLRLFAADAAGCCLNWTARYVQVDGSGAVSGVPSTAFNQSVPIGMKDKTVVVPNGQDPSSLVNAWNTALAANGGGTPAGAVSSPGAGKTWALVEVKLTNSGVTVTDWTTGVAQAVPYTATFTETCTNTDGSTFTRSGSVTYTPVAGQKSPNVTLPNCWDIQPGAVKTNVGVSTGTNGGSTVIETANTPTVDPQQATKYPACATGQCILTPEYIPAGVKCFDGTTSTPAAECVDYWPSEQNTPTVWRCWWGTYRVALSYCEDAYPAKFFQTGQRTQPQTQPSSQPTPTTGALPTTGTNPGTTTDPSVNTDANSDSCWGSGWSWNPISWVYVPVKCALKWAFVPSPTAFDTGYATLKATFDTTTPGKYLAAITGLLPSAPSSSCGGVHVHYDLGLPGRTSPVDMDLMAACAGDPLHSAAVVVNLVLTCTIIVGAIITCAKMVLKSFGFELYISDGNGSQVMRPAT